MLHFLWAKQSFYKTLEIGEGKDVYQDEKKT
jgi:hypothetical protein